ncbi:MAG: hypothetical protein Q8O76_11900 [Chloroflexota bacterium]|nr:hypothetical protein [Chloroflexota bacterium]
MKRWHLGVFLWGSAAILFVAGMALMVVWPTLLEAEGSLLVGFAALGVGEILVLAGLSITK